MGRAAERGSAAHGTPATAEDAAPARLLLIGPPEFHAADVVRFLPERRYQLLALLAARSGHWIARDQLAALLWPEHRSSDARRNLRHVIFRARAVPGVAALDATEHAVRWQVATDLDDFASAVREQRWDDAVALARGSLLAGIDDPGNRAFSEWLSGERVRFEAQWHQAAHAALEADRPPAQRIALAQRLLDADPFDEVAFAALVAAELAQGNTTRAHQLYRDYAARLADELGVEPSYRLRDLVAAPPPVRAAAIPPAPAAAPPPVVDAGFVGRRSELAELALLLGRPDCRLVTILGPGGIGKSSLARHALASGMPGFPGGTVWVDGQVLADAQAAVARLAQQLGADLKEGHDPLQQIAARIQERTLVVLDNAEQLAGLAAVLDPLLAAAPALTLLLTSRARVSCAHEWLLPLEGLAVPDAESRDLEAARAFDSVRLFEMRAAAAQRGFALARHLDAVVAIVDAVGGLPLAIELAAAWVRLLPPAEIAGELQHSFDLLERDPGAPGRPARPEHASIRVVLDRSWALLAPRERDAMLALSVFRGGFTRAAARAVADAPLPLLSSLADKSFLQVEEGGRFSLHPLVAADAAARAAADPRRGASFRARHAEYYANELARLAPSADADHRPLVRMLDAEHANCRAAWRHAIGAPRADLLHRMMAAWRRWFEVTGRYEDGVRHFRQALEMRAPDDRAALAGARAALAHFFVRRHEPAAAKTIALEALAAAEALGDTRLERQCLATLGGCALALGHWNDARTWFERARRLAAAHADRPGTAATLNSLSLVATFQGEYDAALAYNAEAVALYRELDNHVGVARGLCNSAFVHLARADWSRARDAAAASLRDAREHGVDATALPAELLLGAALIELGELDAAAPHLAHLRERCRVHDNTDYALKADYYLARLACLRGRHDDAARGLFAAARSALELGWAEDQLYVAIFVAELLGTRGLADAARIVLHAVLASSDADAAIRTLAERDLRKVSRSAPAFEKAPTPAPDFVAIAHAIAAASSLDDLVARLDVASRGADGKR